MTPRRQQRANTIDELRALRSTSTSIDLRDADDASIEALHRFPRLASLSMYGGTVTDAGFAALARLEHLDELTIHAASALTPACMETIRRCAGLKKLTIISFEIGDQEIEAVVSLPKLSHLQLRQCHAVTALGWTSLGNARRLRELAVYDCLDMTDADVTSIAKLHLLTRLYIWSTRHCGEAACSAIATLQRMTLLDLYCWDALPLEGARRLAQLPKLREITLYDCKLLGPVQDEVRAAFREDVRVMVR